MKSLSLSLSIPEQTLALKTGIVLEQLCQGIIKEYNLINGKDNKPKERMRVKGVKLLYAMCRILGISM